MQYLNRFLILISICIIISCDQNTSHAELFDSTWQTIYETYPDTTFEANDWVAIGTKYRRELANISNEDDLIELLNQMIFELKVSHCIIGRFSDIKQKASPYMFRPGRPGFDIRILDELVIVTKTDTTVTTNILPGSIITKISDNNIDDIISNAPIYPPYNDRYKRFLQTEEIARFLYGETGTSIKIEFLNPNGDLETTEIIRTARSKPLMIAPEIPPIYFEYSSRLLSDDIGYLSFNAFQPDDPSVIISAIDSLFQTKALILDLRGNNGGSLEAQRLIAQKFFSKNEIYATTESRNGIDSLVINGNENAYQGLIAILVDEVSISGAEFFPASMQEQNRAIIIGVQTPGAVMGGALDFLSDDLVIVHPTIIVKTNQGVNLEGVGVIPDIIIPLDRDSLANGVDNQMNTAITFLKTKLHNFDE